MNIAFDADGVIFPIEDFQIKEGQKFFKNRPIYDINGYGIKEVFNCTNKEEVNFWSKNTFKYNRNVIAAEGISELINKLRKQGHKVYILTSRAKANENNVVGHIMRKELEKALERNSIKVDGIIYTSTKQSDIDKYNAIKKYNIHIMIDDKKENVEKIKDITNTICFETRNNKDYMDDKVTKVSNAKELEETINFIINEHNKSKVELLNYKIINKMSKEEKIKYFKSLKQWYYNQRDPFSLEKGENGCRKIIGKMQKVFNLVYKPHVIHKEKFPKTGSVILAANHLHSFDPLLLMTNSDMPFHLLAKHELLDDKLWSKLFSTIGSFFVDNNDPESRREAKEDMIKALLNDSLIMMYPEGTRNKTDKRLLDFHMGTVIISQITESPIYPCAINSDYRLFKNNLCMSVGDPIYISPEDDLLKKNEELKEEISSLLDEVKEYETNKRLKLTYFKKNKD